MPPARILPSPLTGAPEGLRPILLFFRGDVGLNRRPNYSRGIRQRLYALAKVRQACTADRKERELNFTDTCTSTPKDKVISAGTFPYSVMRDLAVRQMLRRNGNGGRGTRFGLAQKKTFQEAILNSCHLQNSAWLCQVGWTCVCLLLTGQMMKW